MSGGPLEGVRVVDLTHNLGGPLATMYLADLGAEVIKVEPPTGDQWRRVDDHLGESRLFHAVNRGKRGIVLDLKTDKGREALGALIDRADVLCHSFSPGVAERIGAGPEEAMARNPRLVHCSLSAFGPGGRRGTDGAVQAETGLTTANGGRPIPVPAHDTLAPLIMTTGILAALLERERSGLGQVVETSLIEAAGALAAHRLIRDRSGEPIFNRFVGATYRTYPTLDGALAIACYAPNLHARLFVTLGMEGVLEDPRFAEVPERARHSDELAELIAERVAGETTATWCARLEAAGMPHGAVSEEPFSLLDHPDAKRIGLIIEVDDPILGPLTMTGPPMRFSRTPAAARGPSPTLGQHTAEVLDEIAQVR